MLKKNKYKFTSASVKPELTLSGIAVIALEVIRLFLAAVFIFSGFVKGIDPLGSTYKFEDYLSAFGSGFEKLTFIAFPAAIALSTFELVLGLCFLLKIKLKTTSILALIFMGVMLPLTLYIAIENPVTDCGCFGDALIISNWATFYKNIFITAFVIIILFFHSKLRPIFLKGIQWILALLFVLIGVGISIYSYRNLPIFDFRPYKVGVNIPEAMQIPSGKPLDKYETKLFYEKEGVVKEFTMENYPKNDSTWVFVEQKSTLVEKGYEPPIHNFNIVDSLQNNITSDVLNKQGKVHLMILYDVNKSSVKGAQKAELVYQKAMANHQSFYALTASPKEDIESLRKKSGITFPFYTTDPITLKTIIRANPGLVTIENGIIKGKWNLMSSTPNP